jgi:hypothetical protein
MGVVVRYGTWELTGFASDPRWSWSRRPEYAQDGRLRGYRVECRISGVLWGADLATYRAALEAARDALVDGSDLTILWDDQTLHSLAAADCERGPRITSLSFPQSDRQYRYRQPVEMTVEGLLLEVGETGFSEEDQQYEQEIDQDNLETRRFTGSYLVAEGQSAQAALDSVLPSKPSGFVRTRRSARYDHDDRRCDYTVEYRQLGGDLPSGVTSGSVTTSIRTEASGRVTRTVTGSYRGAGAETAAEAAEPDGVLVESELTWTIPPGEVGFRYSVVEPGAGNLLSWQETVTKSGGGAPVKALTYPGVSPLLMHAEQEPYRIVQSGSAVGQAAYPTPPAPYYPSDVARSPELSYANRTPNEYEVTWSYEFLFAWDPGGPVLPGRPA